MLPFASADYPRPYSKHSPFPVLEPQLALDSSPCVIFCQWHASPERLHSLLSLPPPPCFLCSIHSFLSDTIRPLSDTPLSHLALGFTYHAHMLPPDNRLNKQKWLLEVHFSQKKQKKKAGVFISIGWVKADRATPTGLGPCRGPR